MTTKSQSYGNLPNLIDLYFYDADNWESNTIRRITGSRYTHCVPAVGDSGLHVDPNRSRWVSIKSLHRILPPDAHISLPVPIIPIALIEEVAVGEDNLDLQELAVWYRNKEQGLVRPSPWSCTEAVRKVLLCCGIYTEQGTPDELYEQTLERLSNYPA